MARKSDSHERLARIGAKEQDEEGQSNHFAPIYVSAPKLKDGKYTKSQIRRAKERRRQAMPVPDYVKSFIKDIGSDLENEKAENWERAPAHVVKHDCQDENSVPEVDIEEARRISKIAGKARTDDRNDRKADLKRSHPDIWGRRGAAQIIVGLELKKGNRISLRTVQKYFQDDKKRTHQGC